MRILALDTATEALSAALYVDGEVTLRESRPVRGHGEWLLPMVDELLALGGLKLAALDAIAVGRGPGAFTGVRIAVSVAQGLAFAADLPMVGVSDLSALAHGAARRYFAAGTGQVPVTVLACLDARLGSLYAAAFRLAAGVADGSDEEHYLAPEEAIVTPEQVPLAGSEPIVVAGHGWLAGPVLAARVGARLSSAYPDLLPGADSIARLGARLYARGAGVPPERLAPVYLRDDVATRSSRAPGQPRVP